MAASLLEDVATTTGALVWRPRQGGLWLLGTTAGAARDTLALFDSMGWPARLLLFPADIAAFDAALEEDAALPAMPAAATIAQATTRARPKRCATSLPQTDTAMALRPARVKSVVGEGSQSGAPLVAITMARKVTAQARSAANSQVCTV